MNLTLAPNPPWMTDALCAQLGGDTWFPENNGSRGHQEADTAKQHCSGCPVITKCLDYALANGERWGVWGGTTPKERQAMRGRP